MHVILKSTDKFSNSSCASEVAKLQLALKNFVDDEHSLYKVKPPFSFAIENSVDKDDNMYNTYYITVKKQWLIEHGLYQMCNQLFRNIFIDEFIENANKFPKYHKYKKEVIYL